MPLSRKRKPVDVERLLGGKEMKKCSCCHRKMKLVVKSYGERYCCRHCYSSCESVTGVPRCHFEKLKIGGYWEKRNSNAFTKLDGTKTRANQSLYFRTDKFVELSALKEATK